jgi:hypothetical protein
MSDVSGGPALIGKNVTLVGLKRFECNGLNGKVVAWDAETCRASVKVDGRGDTLAVRLENLQMGSVIADTAINSEVGVPATRGSPSTGAAETQPSLLRPCPPTKKRGPLRIQEIRHDKELAESFEDIEDMCDGQDKATISLLHRVACERGFEQYVDPSTGSSVFTALQLRTRPCCGHKCRHCPYGHENVPGKGQAPKRRAPAGGSR